MPTVVRTSRATKAFNAINCAVGDYALTIRTPLPLSSQQFRRRPSGEWALLTRVFPSRKLVSRGDNEVVPCMRGRGPAL
jgi:hypothetical protein